MASEIDVLYVPHFWMILKMEIRRYLCIDIYEQGNVSYIKNIALLTAYSVKSY